MSYQSSITTKYGDIDNVKRDVKTLMEILGRQGSSLLIDVIAESVAHAVNKFTMDKESHYTLCANLINELDSALLDRT